MAKSKKNLIIVKREIETKAKIFKGPNQIDPYLQRIKVYLKQNSISVDSMFFEVMVELEKH